MRCLYVKGEGQRINAVVGLMSLCEPLDKILEGGIMKILKIIGKITLELVLVLLVLYLSESLNFLPWLGNKIMAYIHWWGIGSELQFILATGLYLSAVSFLLSMVLYGLDLFELYDFKKVRFPCLPERFFGEYPFFLAIMFNSAIVFFIFLFMKMGLLKGLEEFSAMVAPFPSANKFP